ncbi:MAG: cytochrome c oxidase assembly protein [Cohaesibacter sp.]|nr:cytochrome c oxidase assembly protein [Cohaesibacter sp.]MCV6602038.1 cytochrome c oxidase assembly protein [Cohaesibacter sp.]
MSKANQSSIQTRNRSNRTMAIGLAVFVSCMVGVAYAAVPLYELFCRVTGYGGTTQQASSSPNSVIERTMTVRFDANIGNGLNWDFKPLTKPITLKLGETAEASYQVVNLGKAPTAGTATFNVTPLAAGIYFNKLDCFCFTYQEVEAGQSVNMPVVFFVDPDIDKDPNMESIDTITLSYTFFPKEREEAALTTEKESKADKGTES